MVVIFTATRLPPSLELAGLVCGAEQRFLECYVVCACAGLFQAVMLQGSRRSPSPPVACEHKLGREQSVGLPTTDYEGCELDSWFGVYLVVSRRGPLAS